MSEQGFSVRLTARIDSYLSALEQAKKANKSLADSGGIDFKRLGGKMQDVGLTLSKSVTLPLIAAGVGAVHLASSFESSFQRMVGLAGVAGDEVDGLKQSVLELAGKTAQAPQDLADAMYEASSAGLDTAGALAAVEVAAKGAAVGMGSAQDIVGLVASATAAYGKANITAAQATDILTASIKAGRADPAELAGSLGRILPIASQLGVSFDQVGGATAYLSNIMGNTSETVTALQGFFVQLLSPTEQGKQALLDMGTSVGELHDAIDKDGLMGALDLLREKGFAANQDALRNLFPDVQAFQGALALVSDTSGQLSATLDATKDSAGDLDSAFKGASDTAGFKMKQAWADVQVALIQAGDIIMPIVSGIASNIGTLAQEFSDLPGPVKDIVIALLGLAAAGGPVLIVGGSLVKNFKEIRSAMSSMSTGAATAGLALGAVGLVVLAATKIYSDNAAQKARLVQLTNDFVDALKAEKEGQKDAVDDKIASLLTDKNLLDTAHKLGLQTSDLAKIIKGESVPAWKALTDGTVQATTGLDEHGKVTGMTTYAQRGLASAVDGVSDSLNPMVQALQDAIDRTRLADQVQKDLTEKFGLGTASMVEHGGAAGRLADSVADVTDASGDLLAVLPLTEEQQKANTAATKHMSDALDDSTTSFDLLAAATSMLKQAFDAVIAPTQDMEDANERLASAAEAVTESVKDNGKTLDINTEKGRANRDAIQDQANAAIAQGVAMVGMGASQDEATAAVKTQIQALSDHLHQLGLNDDEVASYIATLGLTPANVDTAIKLANTEATKTRIKDLQDRLGVIDAGAAASIEADIDAGKFDAAEARLLWLARVRDIQLNLVPGTGLKLIVAAGTNPLVRFGASAAGRYVDRPMISTLGEGGRPEVVLPLTNKQRIAQLMADPRVSGPILGAVASADGRAVNLSHTSISTPSTVGSVAVTSAVLASSEDAAAEQDKLMEREFHRDAITYEAYRAYLAKRKEGLELYSDDEEALFEKIQDLDANESRARENDAQIQTDMADRIQKYLADTNQISLQDYLAYLNSRRGAYGVYTDEWMALTGQIIDLQKQMDQATADATKTVFAQAEAVKSLADAQQANQEADATFNAAGAKVTETASSRTVSADEKQAALDDYNRSAVALANTAYNLADALANNQGLEDGTVEWARFMRTRLTADSVWNHANGRDNVANAVDRLLAGIPSFAAGGYVPATPGGRIIRVAEAGQGEWMFPANKMHAMAGGSSLVHHTYNITVEAPPTYDAARGVRDLLDGINRQLVGSGHLPIGGRVRL